MDDRRALRRMQTFLLVLASLMLAGTILELILTKHWQEPFQILPFGLCALGLWVIGAYWRSRGRLAANILRIVMVVVAAGTVLGSVQHFLGNREFALETHPNTSEIGLLIPTLTGRDPLFAPGVLAGAAAAAIAATFAGGAAATEKATTKETKTGSASGLDLAELERLTSDQG